MDNAQKAITIGVGLFIAILVIAAVMSITNLGINIIDNQENEISNISNSMQQQLTAAYDNTVVSGADVLVTIQKYYGSEDLSIYLHSSKYNNYITKMKFSSTPSFLTSYYKVSDAKLISNSNKPSYGDLSDSSKSAYINPIKKYKAYLIKNNSGNSVIGIYFEE